jgi:hypothetical protein
MESPSQAVHRLVEVLEKLEFQEALHAARGDRVALLGIRHRITPVVKALGDLGSPSLDEETRTRIAAIIARRRGSRELVAGRMQELRRELARTAAGLRMVANTISLKRQRTGGPNGRRLCVLT